MEVSNLNKSLEEIFQSKYVVPLYQRNYAWKEDEISQLLQDLYENFRKSGTNHNQSSNYFIGSLIVLKRKDGYFEVIDGQQRLTTLSILLRILDLIKEPKLFYESRPEAESFFSSFYQTGGTDDVTFDYKVSHLVNAVDLLKESIINPDEDQSIKLMEIPDIGLFKSFVIKHVILVRVEIPNDTDVAAYFEIMNNRGEQLQKHEILKSYLIESLKDANGNYSEKQQAEFSKIWDACSQMDTHIQKLFSREDRKKYFGENYDSVHTIEFVEEKTNILEHGFSINEALEDSLVKSNAVKVNDVDDSGKDQSIIDFPNFLMHIFRLKYQKYLDHGKYIDIPLNEKYLMNVYEGVKDKLNALDFINDLLYFRTVFDRYVVKSTDEDTDDDKYKWTLQRPYKYVYVTRNATSLKYKSTFGEQDRFIKSLSLLQVTFRNRKYKNWLQDLLFYFKDKEKFNINESDFKSFLDQWKLKYFDENIHEELYHEGVKTPHFLFNFIDYLYWLKSPSDFKFTYRNSIEHHLPQSFKNEINEELLDNLGNLCLVSKSSNSKMNNEHPKGKAAEDGKFYKGSLPPKQKRMYQVTNDMKNWGNEEITKHAEEVISILKDRNDILTLN